MFHVVTVHYKLDTWIEPQLRYLRRFLPADTRIYASLNGVDTPLRSSFAYAADLPGNHPEKLNVLAEIVSDQAAPDDYIIFIDGDAFPIAPIGAEVLGGTPLAAVRRDENLGDPHRIRVFASRPSAFGTRSAAIGAPADTRGRIELGYRTADVGGTLLGILRDANIEWRALLRTNEVDLHHLWFAIYGEVVYHHGAGFRGRRARATLRPAAGLRACVVAGPSALRQVAGVEVGGTASHRRRPGVARTRAGDSNALIASIRVDEPFIERFLASPDFETEPLDDL